MQRIIGMFAEVDKDKQTKIKNQYAKIIEECGALPVLFPYTEKEETLEGFIRLCDGFLFTGGADVDPKRYGEQSKPTCGEIEYYRDELEFRAFEKAIRSQKPILAICRGMQLTNVALGGTLYQDIESEVVAYITHRQKEAEYSLFHEVEVLDNTPLRALVKTARMQANSLHHQAIKSPGKGLAVMAVADDGIIEAVYAPDKPFLRGYQWHPERLAETDAQNRLIFEEFVGACRKENN